MGSHYEVNSAAVNPNWPALCVQWVELTGAIHAPEYIYDYAKVQLSGRGLYDGYDPRHTARPITTSLFFPRAQAYDYSRNGVHIARSLTLFHNPLEAAEHSSAELRARLLGLSIGKTALLRYNANPPSKRDPTLEDPAKKARESLQSNAEKRYGKSNVPLAIITISRIIHHQLAAPGSEVAFLYVPVDVPPSGGLSWFQENLRQFNQRT